MFDVLYADPPWRYDDRATSGERGVEFQYPTMTDGEICAVQPQRLMADDSVCLLWVTPPRLDSGMRVLRAWGYEYVTIAFTWVKSPRGSDVCTTEALKKLHWGMGNHTRANCEHVLLGRRGRLKRVDAGVHSVVIAPVREHSQKPDEVRQRIERLYGPERRYVELFARDEVFGWTALGNDVQGGLDIRRAVADAVGGVRPSDLADIFKKTRSPGR